jgi:hypothetical protein
VSNVDKSFYCCIYILHIYLKFLHFFLTDEIKGQSAPPLLLITGLEFAVVFPMMVYLLILYGAFSLLFVLVGGLFFSRIGKRFPLAPALSEKMASQEASPQEAAVLKRPRSRSLVPSKAASRVPALSFSHRRAKAM